MISMGKQIEMRRRKFNKEDFSLPQLRRDRDVDSLTGLFRKEAGEKFVRSAWDQHASDRDSPLTNFALIHMDLDNFKLINDGYSYDVGNEVLAIVGRAILHNTRDFDVVIRREIGIRQGGDELLLMLRGGTTEDLHDIFFGKGRAGSKRNICDAINHEIAQQIGEAIGKTLPNNFSWPLAQGQQPDGKYFSAGLFCAAEAESVRELFAQSEKSMKAQKKLRKVGR